MPRPQAHAPGVAEVHEPPLGLPSAMQSALHSASLHAQVHAPGSHTLPLPLMQPEQNDEQLHAHVLQSHGDAPPGHAP